MAFPAVMLLCLDQGDRSLEEHLEEFLDLEPQTTFPDDCLCTFLRLGLNNATQAQLSGESPRESFADYVEWVLVSCGSSFTAEDITSPTPDSAQPEPYGRN